MRLTSPITKSSDRQPIVVVSRANARQRGFTLMELLVVIAILAIVFFALQPNIGGLLRGARERAGLRQLVGLFSYARTEAVGRGCLVRVVYDPGEEVFWLERQYDPKMDRSAFEPVRVLGHTTTSVPESLSVAALSVSGSEVSGGPAVIYFYPDGRTDGAVVVLTDDAGREIIVELSSATGKVGLSV